MADIEKFEINQCIHVSICMHMCIFMLPTTPKNYFFHLLLEDSSHFSLWVWVWLWRDALVSGRKKERARTDKKRANLLLSASWPYLHPSHRVADIRQTTGPWLLPGIAPALLGKGTLIGRSLDCSTCCGHAPACDREANCPHRHMGWVLIPAAHLQGWLAEPPLWCSPSSLPVGFPWAPCTKGVRLDIMESLTPAQLVLEVKGLSIGILFVLFSMLGSLSEAGKEWLYKQNIKAIVFWAMNRSGEGCFLSPICCIVDTPRQNKGLYKSQGPAMWSSIVWI